MRAARPFTRTGEDQALEEILLETPAVDARELASGRTVLTKSRLLLDRP